MDKLKRKINQETVGMYGGKFMPMHKGHLYCLNYASKECDKVYAILFVNGADEVRIRKEFPNDPLLTIESRWKQLTSVCKQFDNVIPIMIDVGKCRKPDGTEDWDMETPLVREYIPNMYRVYSSEPDYDGYFKRAYPEAEHIIIDPDRNGCHISATMIRAMKTREEKEQWLV